MNTLLDIMTFNRERASRHIGDSDRGWSIAGLVTAGAFVVLLLAQWLYVFSSK
jgi:hypothetical protein